MTHVYTGPSLSTDLIIECTDGNREGIVLITRKFPPYGMALPGGHAERGLTLEENAMKEGLEETGLECLIQNPERPFLVKSRPDRDPRVHMVAVVYIAQATGIPRGGDDAKTAHLYPIPEVLALRGKNKFAFDHEDIIDEYLRHRGYL